jgi:hypothetical protein
MKRGSYKLAKLLELTSVFAAPYEGTGPAA